MRWLFSAARRLRELGILGMNRRNAACILDHNPRAKYPLVDDKLRMHRLCREIGVPTPEVYAEIASYSMLRKLPALLAGRYDFVIKPNRGSAGRGVLVVTGRAVDEVRADAEADLLVVAQKPIDATRVRQLVAHATRARVPRPPRRSNRRSPRAPEPRSRPWRWQSQCPSPRP